MDPETEKIIREQMEKLPDEIRSLFTDPELGNKILNIGRKNGIINIEQLGIFQTETNLMMLGLVHPDEYPNELKNQLRISPETANNIINDINTQIFSGIREKLKEIYEKNNKTQNIITEQPLESREEMIRHLETPPARNAFSIADAGGDLLAEKELPAPIENKEEAHPILSQKLSGSFQIPTVETEHSLSNLSPNNTPKTAPKIDPYREIPE